MKRVLFNLTVLLLIALIIRVGYLATTMQPGEVLRMQSNSPLPTTEARTLYISIRSVKMPRGVPFGLASAKG